MPILWDDQKDLLHAFNANGVEYLVVGGHAVSHHSEPRTTKDLDLLLRDSQENAEAIWRALAEFGTPLQDITPHDFREPGSIFQVCIEPSRIDILHTIAGVSTEEAWSRRVSAYITEDRIPASFISAEDLMLAKRAAGRPQDIADALKLEAAQQALRNVNLTSTQDSE